MRKLLRRLRYWIRQRQLEDELERELEVHRSMRREELERSGLPPTEAEYASRRALGNVLRAVWVSMESSPMP